jgi:hypothetical protein
MDAILNDGTDNIKTGLFYCFEDDLNTPILLSDIVIRLLNPSIVYAASEINPPKLYLDLLVRLNKTFARVGSIVYVLPLNVCFIKHGEAFTNWKYAFGTYVVPTEAHFNSIPIQLREPLKYVNIGNPISYADGSPTEPIQKIILSNGTLTEPIRKFETRDKNSLDIPIKDENRLYEINGFLYYRLEHKFYSINDKFKYFLNQKIEITNGANDNVIVHNFNSSYVIGFIRMYKNVGDNNLEFNENIWYPLEVEIIEENGTAPYTKVYNKSRIRSSIKIDKCDIILISKE